MTAKTALMQRADKWTTDIDAAAGQDDIRELTWLREQATSQVERAHGIADRITWQAIADYAQEAINELEVGE